MFFFILVSIIISIFTLIYLLGKYNEYYWAKRGVVFVTKNKFLGPVWDFVVEDRALFEVFVDIYKKYSNEPAVGIGNSLTRSIYVIDPKNVQHVMQTDFHSFSHRGVDINDNDTLGDNILFMHGPRWKLMRQGMTPLFTAAKLKNMFYIIDKSAQDFVEYLNKYPERQKGNAFDSLNEFCSAAIAAAVFGIGTKSTFDSPFLELARDAVRNTVWRSIKFAIGNYSSTINKILKLKVFASNEKFFIGAIKQVIRRREEENVKKHDFADICVSLQKNGKMRDPDTGLEMEPTDELLAAQAFFFFIAGVEPTATAMFGTLIELGKHPDIQRRVHEEIDDVFEKYNGQLNYDAVYDMEYLDKVISEALRICPPIGYLTRRCVRDSILPVGNIKIEKGTKVFTPLFEYHHDPKYYTNPEMFDPERFTHDVKGGSDITYMPFGRGGRICVGMRYARLQAKAGLVHVLRHFSVKTKDIDKMKYNKEQVQVRPVNIDVQFIRRDLKRTVKL